MEEMDRLKDIICNKPSNALINLDFGCDLDGYRYMKGSIKAGFDVICQRCNKPMALTLNITVAASPVRTDDEAEQLPKYYEPLLITEDTLSLSTMVEEEILLGIPIVPKHLPEECTVKTSELAEFEEDEDKPNPFDVLKKLLRE